MTSGSKAVLFDLDETLYPERRFALGGFRAVAATMEAARGVPASRTFALLAGAIRRGRRGKALQDLCAAEGWAASLIPRLIEVIRAHQPDLRLPRASRRVLEELRGEWRIGVVTNGMPAIQRRKARALGLEPLVDVLVCAREHGSGSGKPEAAPFLAAARALDVDPRRCVFVGDDPRADVAGARRAGMKSVHLRRRHAGASGEPRVYGDASIERIDEVPAIAAALLGEAGAPCA